MSVQKVIVYTQILVFMSIIILNCHRSSEKTFVNKNITEDKIVSASGIDDQKTSIEKVFFKKLESNEILIYEIEENKYLKVYAMGEARRELAVFPVSYYRNIDKVVQINSRNKVMLFLHGPESSDVTGLWYLDGENGIAKQLCAIPFSSYSIKLDDEGRTICLYDPLESADVPILHIYEIAAMRELNRVIYEPYRYKGMYPTNMEYKNNAYFVTLSADTIDYTLLEIPLEGPSIYKVVEYYSWEENDSG